MYVVSKTVGFYRFGGSYSCKKQRPAGAAAAAIPIIMRHNTNIFNEDRLGIALFAVGSISLSHTNNSL